MDTPQTECLAEMFTNECFDVAFEHFELLLAGHYRMPPFTELHIRMSRLSKEQQTLCRECVRSAMMCALDSLFSAIHEEGLPAMEPGTDLAKLMCRPGGWIDRLSRYKQELHSSYMSPRREAKP